MNVRLIFCVSLIVYNLYAVDVSAHKTKLMDVVISSIGQDTHDMREIAQTIERDLTFTGQFAPQGTRLQSLKTKKQVMSFHKQAPLFITLVDDQKDKSIEWRAYNTKTGKMASGKKVHKVGNKAFEWGHAVADSLLVALTGNKSSFSTKILYCKEGGIKSKGTQICIADFDGQHEQVILALDTIALAPRWNGKTVDPLILYSEYTPSNLRLMVSDLKGNTQVATSFDGLNMLPAFSDDGKDVIVCLSVEGSSQLYRYTYNKRKKKPDYIRLTHNTGSNLSPQIRENGDIVFCSDYEIRRPQIYTMNKKGKNIVSISSGGSCTSPSYSSTTQQVVYTKLIKNISQIMMYDFNTEKTIQLTSDNKHKEEPSWSTCGNYLMFTVSDIHTKRLAIESLLTNKRNYITGTKHRYTYASCSPGRLFLAKR
jgi:TolB protein